MWIQRIFIENNRFKDRIKGPKASCGKAMAVMNSLLVTSIIFRLSDSRSKDPFGEKGMYL